MIKLKILTVLMILLGILFHCSIFEPEKKLGSLFIVLVPEKQTDKLDKTLETVSAVQCIVTKGSETVYNEDLTKQNSSFHGEITGLEPANDYAVLLYGKNNFGAVIGRGYESGISVSAGDQTSVNMAWSNFKPTLASPNDGSQTADNTPMFDWQDVSGASAYHLQVDNSDSFSSPEIDQPSLTSSTFTPTSSLADGLYYWRVRCMDVEGKWGAWSNVWNFTIASIQTVATPTFNPSPGTYTTAQNVTITCSTSGATINYTTNGADPTESDPSISSGNAVTISNTTTLKARAYKSGWTQSSVVSGLYTITGTVATPTFNPAPGTYTTAQNVTISCSTSGATIHYTTNGFDPTESDLSISSGSAVTISSTTTLKARAYKSGWTPRSVSSGTYTITGTVATPTFNPAPGTYTTAQNVTITCSTSGATIHYTTNGVDPIESDPVITSGSSITITTTTTLKARAYKGDWTPSNVASGTYTITGTVATPTFNPSPGTYTTAQNVTITCSTSGSTIHYTTNGVDPIESDPVITSGSSITITTTTTLKARAYKGDWTPSNVASGTYTITRPFEMVFVQGGTFQMGDAFGGGGSDELPVHSVTLSSFYISKYEITQGLYESVMGYNPSYFTGNADRPVEQVTWYDAVAFCNTLSRREGLTSCYTINGPAVACNFSANGYRLPTEAEWEYAARGGNLSQGYKYSGSDNLDTVAWYYDNFGSTTHPVGQKQANELGLYDMSGNVWEWCWDWYESDYYGQSPSSNPKGPSSGSFRVPRGGSWCNDTGFCRVSKRDWERPGSLGPCCGFRCSRNY